MLTNFENNNTIYQANLKNKGEYKKYGTKNLDLIEDVIVNILWYNINKIDVGEQNQTEAIMRIFAKKNRLMMFYTKITGLALSEIEKL